MPSKASRGFRQEHAGVDLPVLYVYTLKDISP